MYVVLHSLSFQLQLVLYKIDAILQGPSAMLMCSWVSIGHRCRTGAPLLEAPSLSSILRVLVDAYFDLGHSVMEHLVNT